ncbi:hypothetical protein LPW26_16275 [Rhodopseudomonas sp. HC1]|uniref:hypothetical protein n=1 Tax=Rhodopseudomonas infernalis TaxID=2897386 RepID=UPI001EE895BC|nr:hypothetical protein [Rhodopseudomonas infernalis]MCG6206207.1 hypothetical protein [Rhodopseudomonas infernalis]
MPASSLRLSVAVSLALVVCGLAGCGTVNEKLASGMGEYVPQWAGGLPANAPPRPGTAKYDAYMREQERLRSLPAAERAKLEAPAGQAAAPAR